MAKIGELTLTGASGAKYRFNVYSPDTAWADRLACVYYVSKRTVTAAGNGTHSAIYIGETEDLQDRFAFHHKQDCFNRRGYNAISVHREQRAKTRAQVEEDLVKAYDPPCNE